MVLSLVYLLAADFSAAACSLQWFACSWLCFTTAAGSLLCSTCIFLCSAIAADSLVVLSLVYLLVVDLGAAACSLQMFICTWLVFAIVADSPHSTDCNWL